MSSIHKGRADALRRVHNFKALCDALRANDRNITVIEARNRDTFPVGYGHCLGGALQSNRYVTSCEFDLSSIVSGDENENELDPLLHYLSNSTVLRRVYLHDDFEGPDASQRINLIYASLMKARSANTRVEELKLGPVVLVHSDSFQVLQVTQETRDFPKQFHSVFSKSNQAMFRRTPFNGISDASKRKLSKRRQ
jgi:hypothetical protein